jgi:hypothetical protein
LRTTSVVLSVILAAGCSSNAAPQPPSSGASFTFEGDRAKDLVLPVTLFPAGTYVLEDEAMTAEEVGSAESLRESAPLREVLTASGYAGGYVRSFESANGGLVPYRAQVSVLLFRDSPAAKSAIRALTEMRVRQGFSEYSLGTRIGDESRLVGADAFASDAPGARLVAEFQVVYAYLNAVVLAFVIDDKDASPGNASTDLALMELRFLRDAVARQTPKPS